MAKNHKFIDQNLRNILLVTEQQELSELVNESLGGPKSHLKITEVTNSEEAVEKALEINPGVVLMDIGLHSISGVDVARQIKVKLPQCKIILLTMYACDDCPIGL